MKRLNRAWRSVLIVDDDRDTREMYCESLRSMGFDAITASSAEEALQLTAKTLPAVVVTDLRLRGGMDGADLARRIREEARTKRVGIIMLTAAALGDERERAEACGCDRFLLKPCLPEALAAEVGRVIVSGFSAGRQGGVLRADITKDAPARHGVRRKV